MRKRLAFAFLLLSLAAVPASPQVDPCGPPNPVADPYVFILLDISGSMNLSVPCNNCFASMPGESPESKWVMTRQALYNVLSNVDGVNFGFATFANQDALRVRGKHWLYQADNAGPVIPGGGGAFPAAGSQEVFGLTWSCTAGASDGCSASVPADLNDSWEVTRVRRLPKGGDDLAQTVEIYVRVGTTVYKVRYEPVAGGALGSALQTNVTTWRCTNATCSTTSLIGTQTVSWTPVGDFLSWENGTASRTQPYSYFNQTATNDAAATSCPTLPRWEPNGDDTADLYTQPGGPSYSLKQTTDASDTRGTFFSVGDVIPLDWNSSHRDDVLARLAPNLTLAPLATPDLRTAAYFQDHPMPGESFLRLKDESGRPLVPFGLSPLGWSLRYFRSWYDGCLTGLGCPTTTGWNDVAMSLDPLWGCRKSYLLVITDSGEECAGQNPCADVAALNSQTGLKTSVIAVGMPPGNPISCIAQNGKGMAYYPSVREGIEDALTDFFTNTVGVQP